MDPTRRISIGILLMVGFTVFAPMMDACAKLIGDALAVGMVAAARFGIQAAVLVPLAALLGRLHRPGIRETGQHFIRAGLMLIATGCFFAALHYMPMADAIAIFFVEPFILTLLGGIFLREPIGPRRYIACAIGFAGALLIIRPSFEDVGPVALLPLITAGCFAVYMIQTRAMATRMDPITLQAYTGVAALLLAVPVLMIFDGSGVASLDPSWPSQREFWLLALLGFFATLSHVFISFALAYAPASLLAPLQYLEIIAATMLGFYLFGDLPDGTALAGIALIVLSGLYVFLRERQIGRRPSRPLPPV